MSPLRLPGGGGGAAAPGGMQVHIFWGMGRGWGSWGIGWWGPIPYISRKECILDPHPVWMPLRPKSSPKEPIRPIGQWLYRLFGSQVREGCLVLKNIFCEPIRPMPFFRNSRAYTAGLRAYTADPASLYGRCREPIRPITFSTLYAPMA